MICIIAYIMIEHFVLSLLYINVTILPYNEARVRVALSACLPTLLARSIGGTYGRIDGRFTRGRSVQTHVRK